MRMPPALPAPRRKPVTSPALPAHTAPPAVPRAPVRGRIEAPSLVHLAAESIRDMILSGRLSPGDRLIEERLTEELGISRPPLREALRLLQQEGLIETRPRRGSVVATLTDQDVFEILTMRTALERLAVELGVPVREPERSRSVQNRSGSDGGVRPCGGPRRARHQRLRLPRIDRRARRPPPAERELRRGAAAADPVHGSQPLHPRARVRGPRHPRRAAPTCSMSSRQETRTPSSPSSRCTASGRSSSADAGSATDLGVDSG